MVTYESALEDIISQPTGKWGLETITRIYKKLGSPGKNLPMIHIAGTNGKGTLCHQLTNAYSGRYRVGTFTSPHIHCYRERIQVDGEKISKEELVSYYKQLPEKATFFEITFLLALMHFAEKGVDLAIIETGLGGRLDATNIITPILSVITSIDYDHIDVLGDTLNKIAGEKAGIIKPGVHTLLGPTTFYPKLQERAFAMKSPLTFCPSNDTLAIEAMRLLDAQFPIKPLDQMRALTKLPPCRFEVHHIGLPIIFDVAHNRASIEHLVAKLKERYPERPLHFHIGFSKTKSIDHCLSTLEEHGERITVSPERHQRLIAPETLSHPIEEAHTAARAAQEKGAALVITGSFYIMAAAKSQLGIHH
ncbi:MAG: Mur ligase family protein [Simkaniaceae bacterium]|nr:Mur ligase family protein [Simkaniaceae bacterium]